MDIFLLKTVPDKSKKGFSLFEIMVSLSVISIVFVPLFKMQSTSINSMDMSKFYSVSQHLARKKLVDIIQDIDGANNMSGNFEENFSDYQWSCSVTEPADMKISRLKKIDIRISYRDRYLFKTTTWRFVENE